MELYDLLNLLNIKYDEIEHKAVYTMEEVLQENITDRIEGIECKNLFVKNKKRYYLIFMEGSKRANLKELAAFVGESKLSFASTSDLMRILGLEAGSVTPLGIINDTSKLVTVLLDKDLEGKKVLVHPNVNTKTISMKYSDLIAVIEYTKHQYRIF